MHIMMKSYWAINCVMCLVLNCYFEDHGPQNAGSIQTPDTVDSLRKLHRV